MPGRSGIPEGFHTVAPGRRPGEGTQFTPNLKGSHPGRARRNLPKGGRVAAAYKVPSYGRSTVGCVAHKDAWYWHLILHIAHICLPKLPYLFRI
jgi:hypothetical protein